MSENRRPVQTAEDCEALDLTEMLEGYQDGRRNEPCGDNRSRAYWHGWNNGMVDGLHREPNPDAFALIESYRAFESPPPPRGT